MPSFQDRIILLPGNHDRFIPFSSEEGLGIQYRPGGKIFDEVFNDFWRPDAPVQLYKVGMATGEPFALICADFSLRSRSDAVGTWGWLGQGIADDERVDELLKWTNYARDEIGSDAIVWAMHFPPKFEGIDQNLELLNAERLVEIASGLSISCIICGHSHEHRQYDLAENVVVLCAGSASAASGARLNNTIQELAISVEGGRITSVRGTLVTFDPLQGFVPQSAL